MRTLIIAGFLLPSVLFAGQGTVMSPARNSVNLMDSVPVMFVGSNDYRRLEARLSVAEEAKVPGYDVLVVKDLEGKIFTMETNMLVVPLKKDN